DALAEPNEPDERDLEDLKRRLRTPAAGRRHRLAWVPFAVAASVLVGLLGTFFLGLRPPAPGPDGRSPAQEAKFAGRGEIVDRLVRRARESDGTPRRLAVLGLMGAGAAGIEALKALADADPAIHALLPRTGPGPNDPAVVARLASLKADFAFEAATVEDIVSYVREFSGINIVIDARADKEARTAVDLTVKDATLQESLDLLVKRAGLGWSAADGVVVISHAIETKVVFGYDVALLRPPVRDADRAAVEATVGNLADDRIEARDAAAARLRSFGAAAEEALWTGTGSADPEVGAACVRLLQEHYEPRPSLPALRPAPSAALAEALDRLVDLDVLNERFASILASLHESEGINWILVDSEPGEYTV
ncbi:MAG: hypothetical protein L0227_12755, partial [Chloroflexi bacterium]|nr:hypothetical protein [Chloroflexota bacterium]